MKYILLLLLIACDTVPFVSTFKPDKSTQIGALEIDCFKDQFGDCWCVAGLYRFSWAPQSVCDRR